MKKFTLISATVMLAFAGCTCGQGWRPNILSRLHNRIHGIANMGEPCDAGCANAAPATIPAAEYAPNAGCTTCGNAVSAQYGDYNGQVIYDGPVTQEGMTLGSGVTYRQGQTIESVPGVRVP